MANVRKVGLLSIRPEVKSDKQTGKWFVDIPSSLTADGKRKRFRFASQTQAVETARGIREKLDFHKLGLAAPMSNVGIAFKVAMTDWNEELRLKEGTEEIRHSSLRTLRTRMKPLIAFFGDDDVSFIDDNAIRRYQISRLAQGRKPVSINGELRALRQFFGWLASNKKLAAIPKIPRLREERRWLEVPTAQEVIRLLDHLKPSARVLIWLMAETGLRPDEARNLPWRHIDQANGAVRVEAFGGWRPKTPTSRRSVFPSEELMAALLALPRSGDFVFPGKKAGKPIQSVRSPLKTAVKRAGLERDGKPLHLSVKLFRKAFATISAQLGRSPSVVGSIMGHAPGSKMTDQFYTFIGDAAKRSNRFRLADAARKEDVAA